MYKRPQSTHKLPVHSAKGFANFSASLAMLPPTCLHKLGNAKTEANYQTLIKDGTVNGATSNAYLTSSNVRFKTKCIIIKYTTGTLYNI